MRLHHLRVVIALRFIDLKRELMTGPEPLEERPIRAHGFPSTLHFRTNRVSAIRIVMTRSLINSGSDRIPGIGRVGVIRIATSLFGMRREQWAQKSRIGLISVDAQLVWVHLEPGKWTPTIPTAGSTTRAPQLVGAKSAHRKLSDTPIQGHLLSSRGETQGVSVTSVWFALERSTPEVRLSRKRGHATSTTDTSPTALVDDVSRIGSTTRPSA